ncbi:alpha tubulin suppressor [Neophaeococcomyces mojaviensis]|uniref:Alpha tubulin suppressor n=1 Tax=Neophaeococcomyces mojaviensis TaxID=3383035 RepID=A0ACC3AAJ0_9EURO|nr:alpha tubulin suppressor [Knufia sp. JES_112]
MSKAVASTKTVLYALGSNGQGQLGLSHKDDVSRPEKCVFRSLASAAHSSSDDGATTVDYVPLGQGETIEKLVAGGNHTLVLTTSGRVFAAGQSRAVDFCRGDEPRDGSLGFKEIPLAKFLGTQGHVVHGQEVVVTDVATTWEASFFVVNGQKIYVNGVGDKGELGRGERVREFLETEPPVCQIFDIRDVEGPTARIVKVSACMNHVVVLTTEDNLYGWGASRKGQLGSALQTEKVIWRPKRIVLEGFEGAVSHVVTGREFTFLVGRRWETRMVLGAAPRGGFEFPMNLREVFTNSEETNTNLSLYEDMSGIEIHALWGGVVVKLLDGQIHGFGRNEHGQLVDTDRIGMFEKLAAGSEHSVALLTDGTVRAWGWGEHGNCGEGGVRRGDRSEDSGLLFRPTNGEIIDGIGAGCATTFFWVRETG